MRQLFSALMLSLTVAPVAAESVITIGGQTIRSPANSVTVIQNAVVQGSTGAAGNMVQGSGVVATESRDPGDFTALYLEISADVSVTAGDKARCAITADDNILPLIVTERRGDALHITAQRSFSTRLPIRIAIEVPVLRRVEQNASGNVNVSGVTRDRFSLAINGSGDIEVDGSVAELEATLNGSGNVLATGLAARRAKVALNGSGDIEVQVSEVLDAALYGAGDIIYSGSPREVNTSVDGAGEILRR